MRLISSEYNLWDSLDRIDSILQKDIQKTDPEQGIPLFQEIEKNGGALQTFCTAICVKFDLDGDDDSSDEAINNSSLIIRTFLNEVVEILTSDRNCVDVSVSGFMIMAIFDTPFKSSIVLAMDKLAMIHSLCDIVNIKNKQGLECRKIKLRIGAHYGSVIMMQASHVNATAIDIIWTGIAPKRAMDLANLKSDDDKPIRISTETFDNLDEGYQDFFENKSLYYDTGFVNTEMNNWVKDKHLNYEK